MRLIEVTGMDGLEYWINPAQIAFMLRYEKGNKPYTSIVFAAAQGDGSLRLNVKEEPADIAGRAS
jgi:hypothetical protein